MPRPLRFTVEHHVAWLTLDRPEAGNAVDEALHAALLATFTRIAAEPDVRAAVLTGAGDVFCAGADVAPGRRLASVDGSATRSLGRPDSQRLVRALLDVGKPVVAAVNGVAAGLGAQLAFACDLVVMADTASFVAPFARRGIAIDAAGAYLLARLVGMLKAKEIVLLGDPIAPLDAARLGLCNRVVPIRDLLPSARAWADRLADGPTFALGLTKRLLTHAYDNDLDTITADATLAQSMLAPDEPPPPEVGGARRVRRD